LVCRAEKCGERFDGGAGELEDGKSRQFDLEILAHLNFYNEAYLKRFKGIDYVYPTQDNDETFSSAATESDWRAEVERFDRIMSEWRTLLEAADESKFDEAVSATNESLWSLLISHVNAHNAHHGGQIVVIRKLQGSWDAGQGVS